MPSISMFYIFQMPFRN